MGRLNFLDETLVYLDTSPIIYSGEEHEVYQPILQDMWKNARAGKFRLATSALTLLELLVRPLRTGNAPLVIHYEELLSNSDLRLVPITRDVLRTGAELRATQNLKTPDAIHAATAILTGCSHFVTNDPSFRRLADIEVVVLSDLL